MDPIKEAFLRIKEEINTLFNLSSLNKKENLNNKVKIEELIQLFSKITLQNQILIKKISEIEDKLSNSYTLEDSAKKENYSSNNKLNTADNLIIKGLKGQKMDISTGNDGVSTDKQSDKQSDNIIVNSSHNINNLENMEVVCSPKEDSFSEAIKIIDSLDKIKKELRLKFKRLTSQELIVFSTIYQLEEKKEEVDYKKLSNKLGLTESSIRDYIQRLLKKGIPLEKVKIKNKTVHLKVSENLKKIASLETLLKLKDL